MDPGKQAAPSTSYITVVNAFRSFNDILGEIGPFQIWTAFIILVSGISVAWVTLSFVFLAQEFDIRCKDPTNVEACADNCKEIYINHSMKDRSIIYEWGLVCKNNYKDDLSQTILTLGQMFGCLFYGHLADQLGRRPTFLSACMLEFVGGMMVGLSQWYWFFCLTRFFSGIATGGMTIICIVFLVEYVDFSRREFMVVMYRLPYTVGFGTLPALAYFLDSWRALQIVTSSFGVVYISYFWLLPESPRWLFITGQLERCVAVLYSGALRNKRPTERIRQIVETNYDELRAENFSRSGTMVDFFRTSNLCKKTCIMLFAWFTLFLLNYGIIDYLTYVRKIGNIFVNFSISAWLTFPSTLIAYPICVYVDRRYSLMVTYSLGAFCVFLLPMVPEPENQIGFAVIAGIVLVSMSIAFCIMHLYSAELFPTILRNSGMGLCISFGCLGLLIAPVVNRVQSLKFWIPAAIFGGFSFVSAILVLFLPETKGETLPDTIEQGEDFGKNR